MPLEFSNIYFHPLKGVSFAVPSGVIIGVVGEKDCGSSEIMRLAAGLAKPESGTITRPDVCKWVSESEVVSPSPVDLLAIDHSLSKYDAVVRARTCVSLERLRKAGATILIAGHEEDLLARICDEIWWVHEGNIAAKGDPRETLNRYRTYVASRLQAWGETLTPRLQPVERRGNKKAEIEGLELLNSKGKPTMVWAAGDHVSIAVTLKFVEAVKEPVVGMLIRTRIGFEAYGTNTQLLGVDIGARRGGERIKVTFDFPCHLVPGDYTLTLASHDPDGTAHDWVEDAVAFSVVDAQPAAGVANLRAQAKVATL